MASNATRLPGGWSRRLYIVSSSALVVIVALFFFLGSDTTTIRPSVHYDLISRIEVHGAIRARTSESHFSPIQGEAAKVLELAEEGTIAVKGDVVGRLDSFAVEQKLSDSRLELERKRSELKAETIGVLLAGDAARSDVVSMEAQLSAARRSLAGYLEIEAELDELSLRNQLKEAEHVLADKKQKVEDVGEFLEKGYASLAEFQRAERELAAASSSVEELSRRLLFFVDVQRTQEEHKRRLLVADLEEAIKKTTAQGQADHELAKTRISTLEAEIKGVVSEIAEFETQLEGCTMRAKTAGIVVRGTVFDKSTGRRKVEIGDLVWSNVVLAEVTDLSQVDLEVQVPEEQMHALETGLMTTIWLAAEPLTALTGRLRSIGTMASGESGGRNMAQPSVTVRIAVEKPPLWIRPGMTGRAEIVLGRFDEALVVPFSAVNFENGAAFVLTKRLLGVKKRQIEVLAVVDEGVVIGEGLKRRDRILLEAMAQ